VYSCVSVNTHPSRVFGQLVYQQYIGFELDISPLPELKQEASPSLAVNLCDSDGDGDGDGCGDGDNNGNGDGDGDGDDDGDGNGNGNGYYDGDERVDYCLVTNEMTIDRSKNKHNLVPWIEI
jgi:hypothetical protein